MRRFKGKNIVRWAALAAILLTFAPGALPAQSASSQPTLPSSERFKQLYAEAQEASNHGQTKQAISLYLAALQLNPDFAEGWWNAGTLLAQNKDYERAVVAFSNFLRLQPKNGNGWAFRGLCEFELRRYTVALNDIQHGRQLGVHDPALEKVATYHAALLLILKGEFDVADRLLVHLARGGISDPDLITAFGLAALRLSKMSEQLTDVKQKNLVQEVGQAAFNSVQAPFEKAAAGYEALLKQYPATRGIHYAYGDYLLNQAHYEEGLKQMQEELRLNPDDAMASLQIAMTYIRTGRPGDAIPYAEKAVQLSPKLFASHYALGLALYRAGKTGAALTELQKAVRLAPNSPQAHYALSDVYFKLGNRQAAIRERVAFAKLKQEPTVLAEYNPQNQDAGPQQTSPKRAVAATQAAEAFKQAESALREGNYQQAEAGFKEVLKTHPQLTPAYVDLGVVCLRTHRPDEAVRYFETAKKQDPKVAGIDLDLGLAYYQQSSFEKAIPEFDAVLRTDPNNQQARFLKGLCHFMLNDYADTVETLKPLWEKENTNLDYLFVMGISYGKLKRNEECNMTFRRLVEVGGDTPHFHFLLGRAYEGLFWYDQARSELEKAIAGDPKLPEAHYYLGVVDMRLGKLQEAARNFDAEISIDGKPPWSYQKRGQVDLDLNDPAHAILMFKEALARNPRLPDSLVGMGKAYFKQGKFQEAATYFQKAVALAPDQADYHYQLGQAYLRLGDKNSAQREFAETRKLQAAQVQDQQNRLQGSPPPASD